MSHLHNHMCRARRLAWTVMMPSTQRCLRVFEDGYEDPMIVYEIDGAEAGAER